MTLLNIQEMVEKTKPQHAVIERMLDDGHFDYSEANLFKTEETTLNRDDTANIYETLRTYPLREFLAKSGTTGIAGAAYLIPDKIHQVLYDAAVGPDMVSTISSAVITDIPGSSLKVDIGVDGSYIARELSSGGRVPDETIRTTQATITPILFGIAPRITNDLIEDSAFDLIEWHLRTAGYEMGDKATNMALTVLAAGTDGDGTINTANSDTDDITHFVTIQSMLRQVCADEWQPDTIIMTPESWYHNVVWSSYIPAATQFNDWKLSTMSVVPYKTMEKPFMGMTLTLSMNSALYTAITSGYPTNCLTLIFQKAQALLTGRKRWLRIENYSDPVRDLVGAVVTARQDSVTIYNDAIGKITEA